MIEFEFDPRVSSLEKVSVWYAFWAEAQVNPSHRERVSRLEARYFEVTRVLFQRLIEEGGYGGFSADAVAYGFNAMLDGFLNRSHDRSRELRSRGGQAHLPPLPLRPVPPPFRRPSAGGDPGCRPGGAARRSRRSGPRPWPGCSCRRQRCSMRWPAADPTLTSVEASPMNRAVADLAGSNLADHRLAKLLAAAIHRFGRRLAEGGQRRQWHDPGLARRRLQGPRLCHQSELSGDRGHCLLSLAGRSAGAGRSCAARASPMPGSRRRCRRPWPRASRRRRSWPAAISRAMARRR